MSQLRTELSDLRLRLAREAGMPAYASPSMEKMSLENIWSDTVMDALVKEKPADAVSLAKVSKFGEVRMEKYGEGLLYILEKYGPTKRSADGEADGAPDEKRARSKELPVAAEEIDEELLSDEQKLWAKAAISGESFFLTGEAGTGKSFLLAYIIQELKKTKSVAVTATTGLAAANIGGGTIHSFAGVGNGEGENEKIFGMVFGNRDATVRWRETEVLVLDEISMMDARLFELLEEVARKVRASDEPFGGLQVLLCGDFLQLPPVKATGFAFEAKAWKTCKMKTAMLLQQHRQQGDVKYRDILSEVRIGICSPPTIQTLLACSSHSKPMPKDNIAPTRLYCINRDVDKENAERLAELPGELKEVLAQDTWKTQPLDREREKVLDLIEKQAPAVLKLKLGAQVLVTKNLPKFNLVNGSRGIIEGWSTKKAFGMLCPYVRCDNGQVVTLEPERFSQEVAKVGEVLRHQLPIKLGWALTVHRAQGATLSRAELQLQDAFDCGQAYVALSRVKSLEGLWIKGKPVSQREVRAHNKVLNFYFNN